MSDWTCERTRADLAAYMDGELDEAGRAAVAQHIAGCPACSAELNRLRMVAAEVKRVMTAPCPAKVHQALMASVLTQPRPSRCFEIRRCVTRGPVVQEVRLRRTAPAGEPPASLPVPTTPLAQGPSLQRAIIVYAAA